MADERGITTLETVLIAPALLLVIFGCLQFALWYYAGSVVRAAASEAASYGAESGAGAQVAPGRAQQVLATAGGGILSDPSVSITDNGTSVKVTVRGTAPSLVLGMHLPVQATASEPIEAFESGAGS